MERVRSSGEEGASGEGMGRRWVRWMHEKGMKHWVVSVAVVGAAWVKWAVGLGTYSGNGTPPMYGDYEAQRHWMELTIHLPFSQWYTYDLPYWGLDYPPLTAYVSWICGWLGSRLNPTWFALDTSRGIETPTSKVYMRFTVLLFDALIYVPALLVFVRTWLSNRTSRTQNTAFLTLLFQPTLLLIDFGHFQYNSVMLGFTLFSVSAFAHDYDALGALTFVLSLGFKQMALYYAPAIGCYLLGKCIWLGPLHGTRHLLRLATITLLAFAVLFSPWLPPFAPPLAILDPITRIFPLARGLFEDKVANFWCASDVVLKWRRRLSATSLVRASAGLTALGFVPAASGLLWASWALRLHTSPKAQLNGSVDSGAKPSSPSRPKGPSPALTLLPHALLTSSLSFFLFSFQVHEKTFLLPLLPANLLLARAQAGSAEREWGVLLNNVAAFSMWPLLSKDELGVQYIALVALWNRLVGSGVARTLVRKPETIPQLLSVFVYPSILVLHTLELLLSPPARYPNLYPVLNVLLCAPVFTLAWGWSILRGVENLWALGAIGGDEVGDMQVVKWEGLPKVIEEDGKKASGVAESTSVVAKRLSIGSTGGFQRRASPLGTVSSDL